MINPILTDSGARKAFDSFVQSQPPVLPWELQPGELWPAFEAGFMARHFLTCKTDPLVAPVPAIDCAVPHVVDPLRGGEDYTSPLTVVTNPDFMVSVKCDDPVVTAEQIYQAYPRHCGKQAALKAITKAVTRKLGDGDGDSVDLITLLKRVNAYKAATDLWPKDERKFIPHPASWFNAGCYDDDQKEWQRGYRATTSQFSQPSH